MKKDIESKEDIHQLVEIFYHKVKEDPLLSPYFFEHMKVNLEKRIPIMVSFWENAIFYNGAYSGNPMQMHRRLHERFPMTEEHFDRWLLLFDTTVDELFEGEKAAEIKQRAFSIAVVMKVKILGAE